MSDRKFRNSFGFNVAGIGSRQLESLDKEYGKGNWNLSGGKGYAASGTVKQYGKAYGGYRDATVYHKLPKIQEQKPNKEKRKRPKKGKEKTKGTFTPTPLPTDFDLPENPQHGEAEHQIPLALPETQQPQGPNFEELLATQIASMQDMFTRSMQQQADQYAEMQAAQEERMAALQMQMQQAMVAQQQRPTVAGVKMAEGTGGTPMQIARRGVTGAFGRRGMRISGLNV